MPVPSCPLCLLLGASVTDTLLSDNLVDRGEFVHCRVCGDYAVARPIRNEKWTEALTDLQRGCLSGLINLRREAGVLTLRPEDLQRLLTECPGPRDADDLVTHLLTMIARAAPAFGECTDYLDPRVWTVRCFLYPPESFSKIKDELERRGWVNTYGPRSGEDPRIALSLTLSGWEEFRRRQRRGMDSTTAFIATWSDTSIAGAPVEALCSAVREAGLEPMVGSMIAGQSRVTEDIEAGIRRSRLLIADFTGGRAGVYWEAGFARGLGLPVIYTCHESMLGKFVRDDAASIVESTWKSRLHFDTTQFPHIFWSSSQELMESVLKRIRANGWDEPRRERGP